MSKLYVVGLGPGDREFMTQEAVQALEDCDLICGYPVYVDLAKKVCPEKETFTTPMTREVDRCRAAIESAASGRTVAMVCSGDAGVFGMAGLIFELAPEYPPVDIEVVCGVTAALSGASVLGAPLTHDFAVVSLSDRLTPWEKIEKRLACAADADFCIVLYNVASKLRPDYLARACDILLQHISPDIVCGYVRNIGRDGQESHVCKLSELRDANVDMFCTVFIGNSQTKVIGGKMVTHRGYAQKAGGPKE
ncbi:MAG: precorrin-3B C(17)-methyltransferase [Coriobacteriales bacterium]|jgi:precorrin-3B C17-methyltransferase